MRHRRALAVLLAGTALFAACSDDPADDGAAATTATAPPAVTGRSDTTTTPHTTADTTVGDDTTDTIGTTTALTAATDAPATTAPLANAYPGQPAGVPFPTVEWAEGSLPADVDQATIDTAVDTAFGEPDADARVRSIVVVQGGAIVYERYHPLDGPDVVYDSFSVAKSITSALVGMLVADGTMSLDEHPSRPEWAEPDDPRQAITLRQLLQMSSGLEWTEDYTLTSEILDMAAAPNAAAFVAEQPLESEPGSRFEYSTGTTALIAGIAADALGGCEAEIAYLDQRLFEPIGITSEQLLTDNSGCWFGAFGADMTTRDFARFGLLYLRGGLWEGKPIVPTSWIDESRAPAPTNPEYGLQWWLRPDGRAFSAIGHFGQRIVVVPEADLVIAVNSTEGGDPDLLIGSVLAAFGVPG